jgi:hypothetical protein
MEDTSFRNKAAFGKRIEHFLIGKMLKEGLDVYIPMVDDDAIDAVVKRPDGQYVEIQIKARSKDNLVGSAARFAAIPHEPRKNYWFVFYSERLDLIWILSSSEFLKEATTNKNGKNAGKHHLVLGGIKAGQDYPLERYKKYMADSFDRIKYEDPNLAL